MIDYVYCVAEDYSYLNNINDTSIEELKEEMDFMDIAHEYIDAEV